MAWYVSRRSIKWRDGQHVRVEGVDPWVTLALEDGHVGEIARDMLAMHSKYDRRWKWYHTRIPPRLFTMRWYRLSFVEEVLGILLAAYCIRETLRRG